MGDENSIRTLRVYSKPSHNGYRNTIELLVGNNMVPFRSDTIRLPRSLSVLCGICFVTHSRQPHGGDWGLLDFFYPYSETTPTLAMRATRNTIELHCREHWWYLFDPTPFRVTFLKWKSSVLALGLVQDVYFLPNVPSTSDRRLIELENQVQRLMEAHLALRQPTQVNKVITSCEICSGPHNTQYYMEDPKQAFVEYASSRTDEAGSKWYTFKPEQNNLGDTYILSRRSHPNLKWRQP
ncbi:hypothetical protein Tco_0852359 [Tanacetum coccineum]